MAFPVIHLRSETKPKERRSPLSPETAKALIDAGYTVRVEDWKDRIYQTEEFKAVGAEIVPAGSWKDAPKEDIILGLKEIDSDGTPLPNTHIHFHHCFKRQDGWDTELSRFANAGGLLYDLEFLVDPSGRRVAAFGFWAGFAGASLALLSWAQQILDPEVPLGPVPLFESASELTDLVKTKIKEAVPANKGRWPQVFIMGALGRCGKGAVSAMETVGVPAELVLQWDLEQTRAKSGPYGEIAESDVMVNCVYLGATKQPPFVTAESLSGPERRLLTIVDVSCDPNSASNPIPIYSEYSNFQNPTTPATADIKGPQIRIISIDHLPTMVARESSDEYSALLLPSLLTLNARNEEGVWTRAEKTFRERVAELP